MSVITVGMGFMVLIAGRPVYPVFVGGMCFLLGVALDRQMSLTPASWGPFAGPVVFALLGFLAAFAFRRWAAWAAGFGAGGYLVYNLPRVFSGGDVWSWATPLMFAIAGALCVALLLIVFDAFLLFLSSLTAVTMILSNARFGRLEPTVIFLILLIFGMITQYLIYEYARPSPD